MGRKRERKVLIAANRSLITLCSALSSLSCLLGLRAFGDIFTCSGLEGLQCLTLFSFLLSFPLFWLSQCGIVILYAGHLTHQTAQHPNISDADCPLQTPLIRREKGLFSSNILDLGGGFYVRLFFPHRVSPCSHASVLGDVGISLLSSYLRVSWEEKSPALREWKPIQRFRGAVQSDQWHLNKERLQQSWRCALIDRVVPVHLLETRVQMCWTFISVERLRKNHKPCCFPNSFSALENLTGNNRIWLPFKLNSEYSVCMSGLNLTLVTITAAPCH